MADIVITGLAAVNAKLAVLAREQMAAAQQAIYVEAEIIMAASKRRVPVDTGALRASGRVEATEDGARLAYGDAAIDYAIVVHESLEMYHDDGEAKYLERPVLEALPDLPGRVAARMKKATGA